jgi:gamma-glutamylcyclotransferase (GGCT)/AIG2-like uncharacterized protein YtfP
MVVEAKADPLTATATAATTAAPAASATVAPSPSPSPSPSPPILLAPSCAPEVEVPESVLKATAEELKSTDDVLYFAIGSMMNPTSLALREVKPSRSWPGILHDYELVFVGTGGMGSIDYKKGASMHGVLHHVTAKEMAVLDKIEMSYKRLPVNIEMYDGQLLRGTVYQMDPAKITITVNNPPSERYIDIITQGCKHYGVKQSFIDYLKSIKVIPRAEPKDFKKYPEPEDPSKTMTMAEVTRCDGCDGRDLCYVINGKVIKFVGDVSEQANNKAAQQAYAWGKDRFAGRECTFLMARMLYEPKYPLPTCYKDMSAEHKASVEHMWANNPSGFWKAVAYCPDPC